MKISKANKKKSSIAFLFLFGLFLTFFGFMSLVKLYSFYSNAATVNGIVLSVKTVSTGGFYTGQMTSAAYNVENKEYTCSPRQALGHDYRQVGDPIAVWYLPTQPEKCRLDDISTVYWLEGACLLLGLFFIWGGAVSFLRNRRPSL